MARELEETEKSLGPLESGDAEEIIPALRSIKMRATSILEWAEAAINARDKPEFHGCHVVKFVYNCGPYVYHVWYEAGKRNEKYLGKAMPGVKPGCYAVSSDLVDPTWKARKNKSDPTIESHIDG